MVVLGPACSRPSRDETAISPIVQDERTPLKLSPFFVSLLVDAESRIQAADYNFECLQFTVGRRSDGYFVGVNHSDDWLRANGYLDEGQSYRGGHSYCGRDVVFWYDNSGTFQKRVYVK